MSVVYGRKNVCGGSRRRRRRRQKLQLVTALEVHLRVAGSLGDGDASDERKTKDPPSLADFLFHSRTLYSLLVLSLVCMYMCQRTYMYVHACVYASLHVDVRARVP